MMMSSLFGSFLRGVSVVAAVLHSTFSITSTIVSVSSALHRVEDDDGRKFKIGLELPKAEIVCHCFVEIDMCSNNDIATLSFILKWMDLMRGSFEYNSGSFVVTL